ncbi:hypothetical protein Tco_1005044 [Tanacetum coccineum]|uniref:Sulfotransferase n=1 Tax=Tanacetum coccineum TaxID=301880 RepID=A0ABQ5FE06_9ASTR
MGLHTAEEIESARFGVYWANSARQITNKEDLNAYWRGISFEEDFLGTAPSYTVIRDPIMWLCNRLIACSIAGRSQAPEKVISTDLFYLWGMDVGSVNIPYLLARYMRRSDSGRKHEAMIYRRQFVAPEIFDELRVLGVWVLAMGTEWHMECRASTLEVVEGAPDVDEGAQAFLAPIQAPQPAPATASTRTMAQRLSRLEEEVHNLHGVMGEQREVLDSMPRDFSRFTGWTRRRVRHRTRKASTSAAPLDEDHPDP